VQQVNIQQQLKQQLTMETCVPRVAMTPEQIRLILENPTSGIELVRGNNARSFRHDGVSVRVGWCVRACSVQ